MLTDEELKKIKFAFVSHMALSTYYSSVYKSLNTEPTIWVETIVPRDTYSPNELSDEEWENRPKRSSKHYSCNGIKGYARIQTLNKHVSLRLTGV